MTQEYQNSTPLINESIEDVNKSTLGYLMRHPIYIILTIIVLIIFAILAYLVHSLNLIILPIIICTGIYGYIQTRIEHEFMEQFANTNNFSYSAKGSMDGLDGFIFQIGHSKTVTDFINGTYNTYPLSLFNYQYITGSGKSQQINRCTIFKLQFDITMLDILVENKKYHTGGYFSK